MRLTNSQRAAAYGQPGQVDKVTVSTPWAVRCTVHRKIAPVFLAACHEAAQVTTWRPRRVEGYNHRVIAGTTSTSLHSYGLAVDFFATAPGVPPPGGVWDPDDRMPASFAACFTRRGFTWGATFSRRADYPHIEWAGPPPSGPVIPPPPQQEDDMTADQAAQLGRVHHELVAEQATVREMAAQSLYRTKLLEAKVDRLIAKLGA